MKRQEALPLQAACPMFGFIAVHFTFLGVEHPQPGDGSFVTLARCGNIGDIWHVGGHLSASRHGDGASEGDQASHAQRVTVHPGAPCTSNFRPHPPYVTRTATAPAPP